MNRILQRVVNKVLQAFVGAGVSLGEQGELCLPDGLCPERVHRFIEVCMDERYAGPREAIHSLFSRLGISPRAVALLNEIIDSNGDVDFGAAALHTGALMGALSEFKQIPPRFQHFLVHDLGIASESCETLEQAVASARIAAARRVDCRPTWDAILDNAADLCDLARPWRERVAAA
jgi:hypothetical protein